MPYCPECGNEVEEGVSYCESCGNKLDTQPQESQDSFSSEEEVPPPTPPKSPEKNHSEGKVDEEKDEVDTKDAAMGFLVIIVVIILVVGAIYLFWGGDGEDEISVLAEVDYYEEIGDTAWLDIEVLVQNPTDEAVSVDEIYFELETDVGNTYDPLSQNPEFDEDLPPIKK